jgi:hypothetical protein
VKRGGAGLSRRPAAVIVAALAIAGVAILAMVAAASSLQQDLAAYWIAGKARWLGLDPYVNQVGPDVARPLWDGVAPFRHSRFLYPPLAAELFRLLAIVPYGVAKVVFTLAALAGWLLTARMVARRPGGRSEDALAVVIAGGLWFPLYLHLERGQIDLLLLPLVFWAWLRRERVAAAGAALALAATFKPALLGALPVVVALGRWRWAASTLAFCGVAALAGLVIGGPALTREYVTQVLPRAAQYGEGGTEAMLLHEADLPFTDEDGETTLLDGGGYKIALEPFDGPVSASLPRRLSPRAPRWPTTLLPYPLVIAALTWAALRLPRRREPDDAIAVDDPAFDDAQLMSFTAAILACVVTSPTGWVMSFVWALPIAPFVWASLARRRLRRWSTVGRWRLEAPLLPFLSAAWLACALAPLISGWAAVSGLALVVFAAYAADAWTDAA